jgi:FkbM family methyltransferase
MSFIWSRKPKQEDPFAWAKDLRFFDETGTEVDVSKFQSPPKLVLRNENGTVIDTSNAEYPEQVLTYTYLDEDACVLELGARYGSVSCIINKKLTDKKNQVSVEPDSTVWSALENNISINNCEITLHKGFVSSRKLDLHPMGYASSAVESSNTDIPSVSVKGLEIAHSLKFDTVVADCEGFLETFFDENPFLYQQLHTVIFEADFPNKCNYAKIRNALKENGFREIIHGFQNVYKK